MSKKTKYPQRYWQNHSNNSHQDQKYDNTDPNLSISYVHGLDSKNDVSLPQFQIQFSFDSKQILHMWLMEILPGAKFLGLSYDFQSKKVKGKRQTCQKKVQECQAFIQQRKMKVFSEKQLEYNQRLYLQKGLNIRIFDKIVIQEAVKQLVQQYNLSALKKQVDPILARKYIYLMSILIKQEQIFNKYIQKIQQNQITRTVIKQAEKQKQIRQNNGTKKKRRYVQKIEKQQKKQNQSLNNNSDISIEFSDRLSEIQRQQYGSQSQQNSIQSQQSSQSSSQTQIQKGRYSNKSKDNHIAKNKEDLLEQISKAEDNKKEKLIFQQQFSNAQLNLSNLKNWIIKSKKLSLSEFQFTQTKKTIIIKLYSNKNEKRKLNAIEYYLKFQKVYILTQQKDKNIQKLKQNIDLFEKHSIQYQFFQGYIEEGKNLAEVRALFKQNKLKKQKNKTVNEKIVFIFLKGIKSSVDNFYQKIQKFLANCQNMDSKPKTQTKNYMLNIEKIQQYLQDRRIVPLVQQIIVEKLSKIKQIKLIDIFCPCSKFTVQLQVELQFLNQFQTQIFEVFQKQINQRIHCKQVMNEEELTSELKTKYILINSKKNSDKVVLIQDSSNNKFAQILSEIYQVISNPEMEQRQIAIKKNRFQYLSAHIQSISKNDSKKLWNRTKITQKCQKQTTKLQIFSLKRQMGKLCSYINQFLAKIDSQILQKTLIISNLQTQIVKLNYNKFEDELKKSYNLSFTLNKNITVGALVTLGASSYAGIHDSICLTIYKQKSLICLPKNTIVTFLSQHDLHFLNEDIFKDIKMQFHQNQKENVKIIEKYQQIFVYSRGDNIKQAIQNSFMSIKIKYNLSENTNKQQNYAFFMPKNNKCQFLKQILSLFYKNNRNNLNKIFIFQNVLQNIQEKLQPLKHQAQTYKKRTKIQYFIKDHAKGQICYSQKGNQKIQKALFQKLKKVCLFNSDLNLDQITHICSFKQQKIVHIMSKKVTKLLIFPSKVLFQLNGILFQMPPQQVIKVEKNSKNQEWTQVSIGVYQIDLQKNTQTNLFSGFVRNIIKKQIKLQNPYGEMSLDLNFDYRGNQIQIAYKKGEQQKAYDSIQKIKYLIQKEKQTKTIKITKKISEQNLQSLIHKANKSHVQIFRLGNTHVKITSYDSKTLQLYCNQIQMLLVENPQSAQIIYPEFWQQQKSQIQIFTVKKQSEQYKKVQKQFTVSPIKQLIRIQNKILYQKFYNEKLDVAKLNGGKLVKEMMLYHGTKTTNPKVIYEDKQQSFNINYTSDKNYLGRGIYFAEKPQYSVGYSFSSLNQVGQLVRSMFYCTVIVGDSQKVDKHTKQTEEFRDTIYKDGVNKIRYESSTMLTSKSNIYAVYKNRRAYPNYLIVY